MGHTVKYEKAVIGGKIVAVVKAEDLINVTTKRQKRTVFETKQERLEREFMEALAYSWNRSSYYASETGDVHARKSKEAKS